MAKKVNTWQLISMFFLSFFLYSCDNSITSTSSNVRGRPQIKVNELNFLQGSKEILLYSDFLFTDVDNLSVNDYDGQSHKFFSKRLSDSDRHKIIAEHVSQGYNFFSVYVRNQGDYGGNWPIDPNPEDWHKWGAEIIQAGLTPIVWCTPDDSPNIAKQSKAEHKAFFQQVVNVWDTYNPLYVLGLEVNEYWDQNTVNELGNYLHSLTENPVGNHETSLDDHFFSQSWVDWNALQVGNAGKVETLTYLDEIMARYARPTVLVEYFGNEASRMNIATSTLNSGAAGVGCGPGGIDLEDFLDSVPSPPTGLRVESLSGSDK